MFNEEFKKRFITIYDTDTQKSLAYIFIKTSELEEMLQKDVYEFNREELDDLFMSFGCRSVDSVASKFSIIGKYIDFAIDEGFVPSRFNLVKNFVGQEYYRKYVSKVAEDRKILTKRDFDDLIEFCVNDQDKAMFLLIYNSARGRQIEENPLEELRNLKWKDVDDKKNKILLKRNDGDKIVSEREIEVEPYVIEILKDADNQEKYIKNNGEFSEWMTKKSNMYLDLLDTGYILKPTIIGVNDRITSQIISQRLKVIKNLYGNPFITISNIWYSGMVELGKKIKQETGRELTSDNYREICIRFGHDPIYHYKIKQRIEKYI